MEVIAVGLVEGGEVRGKGKVVALGESAGERGRDASPRDLVRVY